MNNLERRKLGHIGLSVTTLGFGAMNLGRVDVQTGRRVRFDT
jgi:aryl-alcohol dehydrogenase-like predicted oxidoreductase